MKSVSSFQRLISSAISLCGLTLLALYRETMLSNIFVLVCFVGVVAATQATSDRIASLLVDSLGAFRRFFLGTGRIEGSWVDVVRGIDDSELKCYSYLEISWREGAFSVEGWNWNPDGSFAIHFFSKQSHYSQRSNRLEFSYSYTGANFGGYAEIQFRPVHGVAHYYVNLFLDAEWRGKMQAKGKRCKFERRLFKKKIDDEERHNSARKFFEEESLSLKSPEIRIQESDEG